VDCSDKWRKEMGRLNEVAISKHNWWLFKKKKRGEKNGKRKGGAFAKVGISDSNPRSGGVRNCKQNQKPGSGKKVSKPHKGKENRRFERKRLGRKRRDREKGCTQLLNGMVEEKARKGQGTQKRTYHKRQNPTQDSICNHASPQR